MATVQWPAVLRPSSMNLTLRSKTASFESPFGGTTQIVTYPGTRWAMDMRFENLPPDEIREMSVFLAQMDGPGGRVVLGDMSQPQSAPNGNPVTGIDTGNLVAVNSTGWVASSLVLKRGQYVSISNQLRLVTADVTSDGNGAAQISLAPMLRSKPQAGTHIEVQNPTGVFRLDKDENGGSRDPGLTGSFTINLVEAFF